MSDPLLPINNSGRCKCTKCGQYFSSVSSFTAHTRKPKDAPKTEETVCRDPLSMGLVLKDVRGGQIWSYPAAEEGEREAVYGTRS